MKNFKTIFSLLLLASLISCGRNEPEEKELDSTEASSSVPSYTSTNTNNTDNTKHTTESDTVAENTNADSDSGLDAAIGRQIPNLNYPKHEDPKKNAPNVSQTNAVTVITDKNVEIIINSPLRNLLKDAEKGKSYSKKELIEQYKFPKEAVDLIKQVTCVGPNKLYFNWGSTWLVEKVSDAKFQNDTMTFTFKKNKTYVSGGAIGIKYNKKIYTELILNKGAAYIPSVKGYHWDINK